jgi:hypothetical protein
MCERTSPVNALFPTIREDNNPSSRYHVKNSKTEENADQPRLKAKASSIARLVSFQGAIVIPKDETSSASWASRDCFSTQTETEPPVVRNSPHP